MTVTTQTYRAGAYSDRLCSEAAAASYVSAQNRWPAYACSDHTGGNDAAIWILVRIAAVCFTKKDR